MADLFVLGRLRAPCVALDKEIEQFTRRLMIDRSHGLYVDDLIFLPIGDYSHFPDAFKERLETDWGDLFVEFDIGRIHGKLLAAHGSSFADVFSGQLFMYGVNSKLWRMCYDYEQGKSEKLYELDASALLEQRARELEQQRREREDDYDCESDEGEESEEDCDDDDTNEIDEGDFVGHHYNAVLGDFVMQDLANWLRKFNEVRFTGERKANLLILITRADLADFQASKEWQKLAAILGESASVVMRSTSAAVIAFEYGKSKLRCNSEIVQQLKPRLIKDFVLIDIGLEVASKHQQLSRLADWTSKRLPPPPPAAPSKGPRILKPV